MSGRRLLIGTIVMGIVVPITIFFFLEIRDYRKLAGLMVTLFMGWCVTDFIATILSRPVRTDQRATDVLRDLQPHDDSFGRS